MAKNYSRLLAVVILCLLGIIIYSNTFHSSFQFDDRCYILENPSIKNLADPAAIFTYWPTRCVTFLTLALNYYFNQSDVSGYHFINLLIHLSSTILVWRLVLLIFSTPLIRDKDIATHADYVAFFCSLVFLTHPIQTQAVTYIYQRATSLAALFYLASLCLYVKARLSRQKTPSRLICYAISLTLAFIGMFVKEITFTLPLTILLFELCFLRGVKKIELKYALPFLLLQVVIPFTMAMTKKLYTRGFMVLAEEYIGISPMQYFLTQLRVVITYIRLLVLPLNQNLDYNYPIYSVLWQPPVFASLIFILFILLLGILLFSKYRLLSFGIFWFFITLLPESSIITLSDVINEHRLYLPMVGYGLISVGTIYYALKKDIRKRMAAIITIIITCYSILTYSRNDIWKTEFSLWRDVIRKSALKARPHNNLGVLYYETGDLGRAYFYFNQAIKLKPNYADAYNNRGSVYAAAGSLTQAISDFNQAIRFKPGYAEAYVKRGTAYFNQGNLDTALLDFDEAIKLKPDYADAYNNRGSVYATVGKLDTALLDFGQAIKLKPNYADAYNNRGSVYAAAGSLTQAISDFNQAIRFKPGYAQAYVNRGTAYFNQGNLDTALLDFDEAIKLKPDYAAAYRNRANLYFLRKEYDRSWEDIYKIEGLGDKADDEFLKQLREFSGRER